MSELSLHWEGTWHRVWVRKVALVDFARTALVLGALRRGWAERWFAGSGCPHLGRTARPALAVAGVGCARSAWAEVVQRCPAAGDSCARSVWP